MLITILNRYQMYAFKFQGLTQSFSGEYHIILAENLVVADLSARCEMGVGIHADGYTTCDTEH